MEVPLYLEVKYLDENNKKSHASVVSVMQSQTEYLILRMPV
jgi:hypothetical protein